MKLQRKSGTNDSRFDSAKRALDALQKRRTQRIEETMRRPLYQEAARSLFFIVLLFVDVFLPLELYYDVPPPNNVIAALVVLVMLVYGEIRMYNTIWGKKGRWSVDKYRKSSGKAVEEKKDVV
jgi:hypothetical protein